VARAACEGGLALTVTATVTVTVTVTVAVPVPVPVPVTVTVTVPVPVPVVVILVVGAGAVRHHSTVTPLIRLAAYAAPKPLSMFTTVTPDAQLLSIASSAAMPPKLAP